MKTLIAVILAAAALGAAPASACDCFWRQLTDDGAPPLQPVLPPSIQAQIVLRDGRGLSQAGFYNDPSAYDGYRARPAYRAHADGPYVTDAPVVLRRRY